MIAQVIVVTQHVYSLGYYHPFPRDIIKPLCETFCARTPKQKLELAICVLFVACHSICSMKVGDTINGGGRLTSEDFLMMYRCFQPAQPYIR